MDLTYSVNELLVLQLDENFVLKTRAKELENDVARLKEELENEQFLIARLKSTIENLKEDEVRFRYFKDQFDLLALRAKLNGGKPITQEDVELRFVETTDLA